MTSISALHGQAGNRRKPARAWRTGRAVLRLALTGDSIVERRLLTRNDAALRPLFDLIRGADVAFTNLEVLANDFAAIRRWRAGARISARRPGCSTSWPAGFDLFATATNHALDYGVSGPAAHDRGDGGTRALLRRRRPQSRGCAPARLPRRARRHRGDGLLLRPSPRARRRPRSGPTCRDGPASIRCATRRFTR